MKDFPKSGLSPSNRVNKYGLNAISPRSPRRFTDPEAFVPGKISEIKFTTNDVAHTFKKGHRIMVQIQSSWFPLVDRNPQKFVDIYTCSDQDF